MEHGLMNGLPYSVQEDGYQGVRVQLASALKTKFSPSITPNELGPMQ